MYSSSCVRSYTCKQAVRVHDASGCVGLVTRSGLAAWSLSAKLPVGVLRKQRQLLQWANLAVDSDDRVHHHVLLDGADEAAQHWVCVAVVAVRCLPVRNIRSLLGQLQQLQLGGRGQARVGIRNASRILCSAESAPSSSSVQPSPASPYSPCWAAPVCLCVVLYCSYHATQLQDSHDNHTSSAFPAKPHPLPL